MVLRKMTLIALTLMLTIGLAACGGGGNNNGNQQSGGKSDGSNSPNTNGASAGATITVLSEGAVAIGVGELEDLLGKKKEALIADETIDPRITEEDFNYKIGDEVHGGMFPYLYQSILLEKMAAQNIKVNMEDWGWGEQLIQKQTAGFLAKNIPDVIVGETQMLGFAQQGLLEPFPEDMAQEIREKVAPAAWKPLEYEGKLYGFASQPGVSSLFWNKKLVEQAGIDPDKAPETWDEFLTNVQKVTEAGKGQFYGGGVYAGPNAGGYLRYGTLLVINGGGFADDQGQPIFNSDANVETVKFLKELNKAHPAGLMANTNEGTYFDAFKKEQIAYLIDGPWRAIESKNLDIDYGMAKIPLSPNGKDGNITIGAAFHSVPKDAKNKEAAFAYIRELYSEEIQHLVADTDVRSPVLKSISETESYQADHPEMYQHYLAMSGNVQGLPSFAKEDSKVWQMFGDAVTKSLMTNGDIQSIMDDVQKKAEAITK